MCPSTEPCLGLGGTLAASPQPNFSGVSLTTSGSRASRAVRPVAFDFKQPDQEHFQSLSSWSLTYPLLMKHDWVGFKIPLASASYELSVGCLTLEAGLSVCLSSGSCSLLRGRVLNPTGKPCIRRIRPSSPMPPHPACLHRRRYGLCCGFLFITITANTAVNTAVFSMIADCAHLASPVSSKLFILQLLTHVGRGFMLLQPRIGLGLGPFALLSVCMYIDGSIDR